MLPPSQEMLVRSVLLSLQDYTSEGRVAGGLLQAGLELATTGSMERAWLELGQVDHVQHTKQCLLDHKACTASKAQF